MSSLFQGIAAKSTDWVLPKQFLPVINDDSDIEEEHDSGPVQVLESVSEFKNITIWGHDQIPTTDDPFVKGIEEWISFAQTMHENTELGGAQQK